MVQCVPNGWMNLNNSYVLSPLYLMNPLGCKWSNKVVDSGLKEYSVVYTDRAYNLMSQPFQECMRDINRCVSCGIIVCPRAPTNPPTLVTYPIAG